MNTTITRYCELVEEINILNKRLKDAKQTFYDGGHSFEEVYKYDIEQLNALQKEFEECFIIIYNNNL